MKTIIYQSYRKDDVPEWISQCMASVRQWADASGFDYAFVGDELFDCAPRWYREKVQDQVHLVSDLARLVMAKKLLFEGYEKAVWVDADVLVFGPEKFSLPLQEEYALCREVWLHLVSESSMGFTAKVNNAVALFSRDSEFLDFYLYACREIVKNNTLLPNNAVGTELLTSLNAHLPLAKINNVGMFNPIVNRAVDLQDEKVLAFYMQQCGNELSAANLCASFINRSFFGIQLTERDYLSVIAKLLGSGGDVVNRFLTC